jgi:aminocarboxymuconate-semialdehyde decarboxylase
MKAIDIHCHIVPAEFPAAPCSCVASKWPSMDHRDARQSMVMVGKREFRVVDSRCWDVQRRMQDMDEEAVDVQVLSPMPELLSYWLDAQAALTLSRHVNDTIAAIVRSAPARFVGLGMVPLQDVDLAAKELSRLKSELGLAGIEVGSNIDGRSPGDPGYDEFYAEVERLGLAIFVHSLHPTFNDRLIGPKRMVPLVAFPTDVGLAAASMISGRVLEKFPRLRIAFSHGGGTLASFLPRLHTGWRTVKGLNAEFADPLSTARQFYFDNVVFDSKLLRYVIDVFGTTQVCVGSDYPFKGGQKQSSALFDGLGYTERELGDLRRNNAARFLALQS